MAKLLRACDIGPNPCLCRTECMNTLCLYNGTWDRHGPEDAECLCETKCTRVTCEGHPQSKGEAPEMAEIVGILKTVRVNAISTEAEIHEAIGQALKKASIRFRHEYRILTHKQFDFWIAGIVIEVKKEKPRKVVLLNQLDRYTRAPAVKAIIVVMQESMHLPKELNGKPIVCVSLNQNWGVAI